MRAFTVHWSQDPNPDRGLLVMGVRPDGALLVADGDTTQMRWLPAEECTLGALHFDQDEREWWRQVTAPPVAG